MWRLPYTVIKNIFILPGILNKMERMAADNINEEECYVYANHIADLMQKSGHIHTLGFGMENLPKEGGYMMYPNHQGKYDTYGIVSVHDLPCSVVMDQAKSHGPFIRQIIDLIRGKRMDINDTRQALTVINEMTKEVSEGRRFILFPEGGYSKKPQNVLNEFKPGCFKISLKSKTPIVPVVIWNSGNVYNSWQLTPVTTQVHFLPAIPYEEFQGMKTVEIAELVKTRIQEKLDELATQKSL